MALEPKSVDRPSVWNDAVEEAYRFQLAGYRDEVEYKNVQNADTIMRWDHNGYVKRLTRRDGTFNYFDKARECPDKEISQTKIYTY